MVGVTHEERLGGEGVGLHVDVGASELVHEGRLTHVGIAAENHGPEVRRTYGGQEKDAKWADFCFCCFTWCWDRWRANGPNAASPARGRPERDPASS